jgi:hypothetical protein
MSGFPARPNYRPNHLGRALYPYVSSSSQACKVDGCQSDLARRVTGECPPGELLAVSCYLMLPPVMRPEISPFSRISVPRLAPSSGATPLGLPPPLGDPSSGYHASQ